jgi:hypothetical protein
VLVNCKHAPRALISRTIQLIDERPTKMILAPLNTLVLGNLRLSSMVSLTVYNLAKIILDWICYMDRNMIARKILLRGNPNNL